MPFAIAAPAIPSIAVAGGDTRFPVHRIYCIGRNYADHAKEMGVVVERSQPMFFMKPADAIVVDGADIPYPPATTDLHHEVEMIVALARGGRDIAREHALDCVFGYGVGLDLTRRDLQAAAKAKGHPWSPAIPTPKICANSSVRSNAHNATSTCAPISTPTTTRTNSRCATTP